MTAEDAVPILARWIRELQCDLADQKYRNVQLERLYLDQGGHKITGAGGRPGEPTGATGGRRQNSPEKGTPRNA